jgi:4-amino-4-deoxychorismate lyase
MRVLVDGVDGAALDPADRGLQYGDGLFETIAWRAGRPRLGALHLERLDAGCRRLGIPAPPPGQLLGDLCAAAGGGDATVKLIVTRGSGPRGYRPPGDPRPRRIVTATEPTVPREGPWHARICSTRLGRNPALAGLKHLNRLEQVLARAEWNDPDVQEGLMLDDLGRVVCGTQTNLFIVEDGRLLTPAVDECGVAGVMRRAVLAWARDRGLAAAEVRLEPARLFAAHEAFLTSALAGARALAAVEGRAIGQGSVHAEFSAWLARQ